MSDSVVRFDPRPRAASAATPVDCQREHEAMLERATALLPTLRARAARTEELRRLPPETEKDLHEPACSVSAARRVGGGGAGLRGADRRLRRAGARRCGGGLNVANLGSHHWMLAMFDKAAQDLVWDENPDALIASSFVFPAGRARRANGGYVIKGRWPFSSGVEPSDWNMLAGIVSSDDETEAPEYRIFLVHRRDYRIIDTWNAMGPARNGLA